MFLETEKAARGRLFLSSVIAGTADCVRMDGNLIAFKDFRDGFGEGSEQLHIS